MYNVALSFCTFGTFTADRKIENKEQIIIQKNRKIERAQDRKIERYSRK